MNDEYIIINRIALEKRVEKLKKQRDECAFNPNRTDDFYRYNSMIKILEEILSQSTPLIPLLENSMNVAREIKDNSEQDTFTVEDISGCTEVCTYGWKYKTTNEDYITNLKLNI